MITWFRDQYQRRVPVTTFTLRVRKHVTVFRVDIGSAGAVVTVVIRPLVTSKLIARHMIIVIIIIIIIITTILQLSGV
jgi:hypothetical protein